QDYIMHHILSVANKKKLFIQFHTGLLEGNRGILSNSNPEHLENLFSKYPDVKFDIFHTGYPYQNITAALAKMYPNVFIDMCWSHIISPFAARKALSDFLDAVPYNKIMGFGGDYAIVDAIYGHLKIARENIARVLSQKVEEDGGMSIDRAAEIAHRLLYDNPKEVLLEY
ncbi:MAG: amidohydrolase family protein, partial [Kosmotoga sp.]